MEMINLSTINLGIAVIGSLMIYTLLHFVAKHFKLKHVWTIHLGLGLLTGFLVLLFLHVQLPDGGMREFLVGDTKAFKWPFTLQNAMWLTFSVTIWMLLAEGKLGKNDENLDVPNLDAHIDGRIEPVRFLIWLIPTLGFLGTIVGMSFAIRELAVSDDLMAALQGGELQSVMVNLGTAFYTTILGLLMNAVCFGMLSFYVFKHKQVLANKKP